MSESTSTEEPFPQPQQNLGGEPCGECHLQSGETCDICGALSPAKRSKYKTWGEPYCAALARGHDHGSAAYIADQWEAHHGRK